MWNSSRSLLLTRILTAVLFVLLIAAAVFLPRLMHDYLGVNDRHALYSRLLALVYASLVPAAAMLVVLWRLLGNIAAERVFTESNIRLLRILSWCSFAVAAIYGVFGFYFITAFMIAAFAVFLGLVLRVIKNVFQHALEIKTENDFTV